MFFPNSTNTLCRDVLEFFPHISPASVFVVCLVAGFSCAPSRHTTKSAQSTDYSKKIQLDLSELDENGLVGPPDGKVSISYEFCIPFNDASRNQVHAIDPSVRFFHGPSGRVGCDDEHQYLCIGSTGPDARKVIVKLAKLDFIDRIARCHFE